MKNKEFKPAEVIEPKKEEMSEEKPEVKKGKNEQEYYDYEDEQEDNWDMSDADLQDNSQKQAQNADKEKELLKSNNLFDSKMQNVVNFDEIPTIKDSKNSLPNNNISEEEQQ